MVDTLAMSLGEQIRLKCPNLRCRRILSVPAHTRGKVVRCKHCQTLLRVPAPAPPSAAEPSGRS